jgi:inositol oxygenase
MNCALFGLGRAGFIHYQNILNNESLKLKYIFDKNIDNIKNKVKNHNLLTTSIEEILYDSDIKLVIISTPTFTHYELTKSCLQHHKHVLCEKPLSENEKEIIECYDIAKKNKLVLLCALNRRFDPNIIKLKEDINDFKIGHIHQIMTISRDFPYPTLEYLKISNGIFHDCVVHDIDFVNWLLNDKPISVFVTGNKVKSDSENGGNLDNAIIIMEYSNGIIANINCSRISKNYDQRIEVYGEYGILKSENPFGDIKNFKGNPISFPTRYYDSYINELQHIINVIKKKEKLKIKEEDCVNCYRIVEACEESFKKSSKITVKYSSGFRNYNNVVEAIKENYFLARKNQTLDFVKKISKKFSKFNHKMKIDDVFLKLEHFIDVSDPDVSLPNYYHGFQTAEAIRKDGHPDWLQLVGLIHDLGKIMYLWGNDKDGTSIKKQWAIVGDTFIVGCKLPEGIVFPEFNKNNPDMNHEIYKTQYGIYQANCGLDQVYCSWGHDEYLYRVLRHNKCILPEEAYYIIRYHSLYSYHKNDEYQHLTNEKDKEMFKWLKLFNQYDLYTKSDNIDINDETKKYYQVLIKKYLRNGILWF